MVPDSSLWCRLMLLDFDCYQALVARDARFDGRFFVAVKSTGIYCRPICSARTPRESSCLFMETAAAAELAGFRPCLRCRPELAPSSPAVSLEEALYAAIRESARQGDSVDELAAHAGFSARQLRRLMVRAFGVSPVQIMQTERLLFAKKLLQETSLPTAQVALSAGFGSVRRFNTLFRTRYSISPTALRRQGAAELTSGKADTLKLRLTYRPPLAWRELLEYLSHRAVPGVEFVDVSRRLYARTVIFGEATGWVQIEPFNTDNYLEVTLPATLAEVSWPILTRLRAQFDLDANPANIDVYLRADPLLAPSVMRHPGLRVPGAWDAFELAVRAVLGQQISVAGASTLAARLAAKFGQSIETPFAWLNRLAPTSRTLAAVEPGDIATIGLPCARATTLSHLAIAAERGELTFGPAATVEDVVAALRKIPGIGEWTAQYVAMRALRFPDAFPAADLGVRKALVSPGKALPNEKQVTSRAASWRPWRAYATLHLWQTLHDAAVEKQRPGNRSRARHSTRRSQLSPLHHGLPG
jgi:AraC family transcriptional regulator, regulatory protein of adaptative response / DNA-3-methyladenine glycosylase II